MSDLEAIDNEDLKSRITIPGGQRGTLRDANSKAWAAAVTKAMESLERLTK